MTSNVKNEVVIMNKEIYESLKTRLDFKPATDIRMLDLLHIFNFMDRGDSREEAQDMLDQLFVERVGKKHDKIRIVLEECYLLIRNIEDMEILPLHVLDTRFKMYLCEWYIKLLGMPFGVKTDDLVNDLIEEFKRPEYGDIQMAGDEMYLMCYQIVLNMAKFSKYYKIGDLFEGKKRRFVLKPKDEALAKFQFETNLIGKKFPRLVRPVIDRDRLIRNSYKNAGDTVLNESSVEVIKYLTGVKYRINSEAYDYFDRTRDD